MTDGTTAALLTVIALGWLATPAAGQDTAAGWTASRTPDGQPDLQGIWSFATITPLERPSQYEERQLLTNEEIAAQNQNAETRASSDRRGQLTPERDVALAYNQFWWDRGQSTGRTSLDRGPTKWPSTSKNTRGSSKNRYGAYRAGSRRLGT